MAGDKGLLWQNPSFPNSLPSPLRPRSQWTKTRMAGVWEGGVQREAEAPSTTGFLTWAG